MRTLSLVGLFFMLQYGMAADPTQFDFPNPLVMQNGTQVATKEDWLTKRKPELKTLFEKEMYGALPRGETKLTTRVLFADDNAFGGTGSLTEIELSLFAKPDSPPIRLLIAVPKERPRAGVPVFVGLNFCGNHCLIDDDRVRIPTGWMYDKYPGVQGNRASAEGRGKMRDVWPLADIVRAGYAVVTCYNGDIQEDRNDTSGPLMPFASPTDTSLQKPKADSTATIMLWAWGLHRIVDYVAADQAFDAKRVAVIGHSRLGKAALVAGAFDDRIAVIFPHQAGCGGTAPSRHANPKAEGVKRINKSFPHWFNANFKNYNDDPTQLPFDQHSLLALCAPRAVLYSNAADDEWANPTGQFEMMTGANPVYKLFGVEGISEDKMPNLGSRVESRLGYWIRAGKHEMNRDDWTTFLSFAKKWLK
jgi:hypothetical protein